MFIANTKTSIISINYKIIDNFCDDIDLIDLRTIDH